MTVFTFRLLESASKVDSTVEWP